MALCKVSRVYYNLNHLDYLNCDKESYFVRLILVLQGLICLTFLCALSSVHSAGIGASLLVAKEVTNTKVQ